MNKEEIKAKITESLSPKKDVKMDELVKSGIIPDSFKCPLGEDECAVFGATDWYCPYAAMPILEERRFNRDCKFAPPPIWLHMKTLGKRIMHWVETEGV